MLLSDYEPIIFFKSPTMMSHYYKWIGSVRQHQSIGSTALLISNKTSTTSNELISIF